MVEATSARSPGMTQWRMEFPFAPFSRWNRRKGSACQSDISWVIRIRRHHAVAPAGLCRIERDVGALEQVVDAFPRRDLAPPERAAQRQRAVEGMEPQRRDGGAQPLGELHPFSQVLAFGQDTEQI